VGGSQVRLFGIAAPASGQLCQTRSGKEYDCFQKAIRVLQSLIEGDNAVRCTIESTDRTGQAVGLCRSRGVDLGAAMVSRGWAFAYRRLSLEYAGAEAFAQTHRLGLWAGRVETPWQWRSRQLRERGR
jgi:endonuclease YncB( thermonuclease family)